MTETTPVVVFDFDLTLTRWDMSDGFFRWLMRRNRWRRAVLLLSFPLTGWLLPLCRTRKHFIRFVIWLATLGHDRDALPELAEQYLRSLPEGHASALLPVALERVQWHLDQGHQVVVATGCLESLARALLTHAGFAHVPLVASTLRPFMGGLVSEQHCFARNKVRMLAARGFAPPWAAAYTDHHVDLPLLEQSDECYLVSPTPESLDRIRRILPVEATILAWRQPDETM
ncbi:MAG TPA: HAD family hydrolase [Oleiagrimonas sp.]|nr:HAD family hydrolase [Oleiagrimonas sp.]